MKLIDIKQQQYIKEKFFANTAPATHPVLYAMAGIPAAGKTSFIKLQNELGTLPANHYHHDPDLVMENIFEYKSALTTKNPKIAKQTWELPARQLADNILYPHALTNNINIVMDMGMCRPEILKMVQMSKKYRYKVHMNMIYCDLNEAITRSHSRQRYVSEQTIIERAGFFASNIETIISLSDEVSAWNNSDITQPFTGTSVSQIKADICQNY